MGTTRRSSAAKGGAGGENRTLDLPLTKGLRYHYATPASGAQSLRVWAERTAAIPKPRPKGKAEIRSMPPKDSAAQERLAKALRENLKRRKAAQRARAAAKPAASETQPEHRPNKGQKPN